MIVVRYCFFLISQTVSFFIQISHWLLLYNKIPVDKIFDLSKSWFLYLANFILINVNFRAAKLNRNYGVHIQSFSLHRYNLPHNQYPPPEWHICYNQWTSNDISYHYHSDSPQFRLVSFHSWSCMFSESEQMYKDMSPPLQYYTESTALNILCA